MQCLRIAVVVALLLSLSCIAMAATQPVQSSMTFCPLTESAAVNAAEKYVKPGTPWRADNDEQTEFLTNRYNQERASLRLVPEITSKAGTIKEINDFMKKNGLDIQLEERKDEFGAASVLDYKGGWCVPGTKTTLEAKGKSYPAVFMEKNTKLHFIRLKGYADGIIIETENGDTVAILPWDKPDRKEINAFIRANNEAQDVSNEYSGVKFPKVSINQEEDLSWLKGLNALGVYPKDFLPIVIRQAKMQNILQIDEFGIKAKSGVALGVARGMMMGKMMVIDRPFLVVIDRPGLNVPMFAAYVSYGNWQAPATPTIAKVTTQAP